MPTQVRGALERALHALREFTVAQRTLALIGLAGIHHTRIGMTTEGTVHHRSFATSADG